MKYLVLTALFGLLSNFSIAQLPILEWAGVFKTHSFPPERENNNGRTVAVDPQGNVYSAGFFQNTQDFDPGPGFSYLTATGPFSRGIYLSKLDAAGNFVWAKQFPVLLEFSQIKIKLDKKGNVYLSSELSSPADMDPGSGVSMMVPAGVKDAFVVKMDPDGNFIWAKQLAGTGSNSLSRSYRMEIDQNDNIIIVGEFLGTVDFDPGAAVSNLTSSPGFQPYIAKLTSNGDLIWAKRFPSQGATLTAVIADPNGDLVVVGFYGSTSDFDPSSGVYNMTSTSPSDGFVAKLNSAGGFIWAKSLSGPTGNFNSIMRPASVVIDGANNVIVTGDFLGVYDFDPGSGVSSFTSKSIDCFTLKLTSDGGMVWTRVIGGSDYDFGTDVVTDSDNSIYIAGNFGPVVDFDPGPGDFTVISPNYGPAAIVKLSSSGAFMYVAPIQTLNDGTPVIRAIAIDPDRNLYISGSVGGDADFDPGPGVFPLVSSQDQSPIVAKYSKCKNPTGSSLTVSSSKPFVLNDQTYDSTGTYTQVISNAVGCDSLITLNLTITRKRTQQSKEICEGEGFFAGGAFQKTSGTFIDTLLTALGCDSIVTTNLKVNPIPVLNLGLDRTICNGSSLQLSPGVFNTYLWQDGSTASSFIATQPGVYWLRVANASNCLATDTLRITGFSLPPANFLKEKDSLCQKGELVIQPTVAFSAYIWSTGQTARSITVRQPGTYALTVTDKDGCQGKDTIQVYPKECTTGIYFPNAFTPNNDGKNDRFGPIGNGKFQSFKLQVFDWAGQIVFQSTDPNIKWDGQVRGKTSNSSVFVWQCTCQLENDPVSFQKGTVTVIR